MESQLYDTVLLSAGIVNLMMAMVLVGNSYAYRYIDTYNRARMLTGLALALFGIGFLAHYAFQLRTFWPEAATALSVTYFHLGGVLISWSHISLLDARYLARRVVIRDVVILLVAITGYWLSAVHISPITFHLSLLLFFLHISWLAFVFYRTYYRVCRRLAGQHKTTVEAFVRWMLRSCHLIILFGLGSVLITALVPTAVWPFTVLLVAGMAVFIYIFYSLTEYGSVVAKDV